MNRALLPLLLALPLGCRGTFDIGKYLDGESGEDSGTETVHATSNASETQSQETSTSDDADTDTDTDTDTNTDTDTDTDTDTNTDTDTACAVGLVDIGSVCIGLRHTLLTGSNPPTDMLVATYTADELPDLLLPGTPATLFEGVGEAAFGGGIPVLGTNGPKLAAVDWNLDSRPDFAVINDVEFQLFISMGNGSFDVGGTIQPGGYDAVFADFDLDGDDDVFVSGIVLRGFQRDMSNVFLRVELSETSQAIAAGDLDGDGDDDVLVALPNMGLVSVIATNPDWSFGLPTTTALPLAADVAIANFDGDRRLEFVAVGGDRHGVLIFGELQDQLISVITFEVGELPRAVAVGDIDGDSLVDVAVGNAGSHDVSLFVHDGITLTSEFRLPVDDIDDTPASISVTDLDADGLAEIIVGMVDSNRVLVYGAMQ